MGEYRCLKESMGAYGFLGVFWFLWAFMGIFRFPSVYGCLWGFMGVYGCHGCL